MHFKWVRECKVHTLLVKSISIQVCFSTFLKLSSVLDPLMFLDSLFHSLGAV